MNAKKKAAAKPATLEEKRNTALDAALEEVGDLDPHCDLDAEATVDRFLLVAMDEMTENYWVTTHASVAEAQAYLAQDDSGFVPQKLVDLDTGAELYAAREFSFAPLDEQRPTMSAVLDRIIVSAFADEQDPDMSMAIERLVSIRNALREAGYATEAS